MPKSNKNNKKGMTYAEVAVCLFVMTVIISPICMTLVNATKTRVQSEAISISTLNAEGLMEDIKQQLTEDIALKNRRDGDCLIPAKDPASDSVLNMRTQYLKAVPTVPQMDLKSFFNDSKLNKKYTTEYDLSRYAYEVAIWDIKDVLTSMGNLELDLNSNTLQRAVRLYSTTQAGLCFDSYPASYTTGANLIKLDVSQANAFKDELYINRFIPNGTATPSNYLISGCIKMQLEKENLTQMKPPVITSINGNLGLTQKSTITAGSGGISGYVYQIDDTRAEGSYSLSAGVTQEGVVILDLRKLIRDFSPSLTFKFINNTGYPMVIKVLRNTKEGEDINNIDAKFNIEGIQTTKGNIVIERVLENNLENNFFIALIVRDKSPRIGNQGKIIKKMAEIYSYTPN